MDWGITDIALACFGLILAYLAAHHNCFGKGKYITVPMYVAYIKWQVKKGKPFRMFSPSSLRLYQVFILFAICLAEYVTDQTVAIPLWVSTFTYFVPVCALYIDDLLTLIDKDKWKKRWQSVKNKVQWKWVPAPVPVRIQP